jgi:hypothetical protein
LFVLVLRNPYRPKCFLQSLMIGPRSFVGCARYAQKLTGFLIAHITFSSAPQPTTSPVQHPCCNRPSYDLLGGFLGTLRVSSRRCWLGCPPQNLQAGYRPLLRPRAVLGDVIEHLPQNIRVLFNSTQNQITSRAEKASNLAITVIVIHSKPF